MTTTRQLLKLAPGEYIAAVVPEYCAGPGYSNRPLWVYIRNGSTYRQECIQPEQQTPAMHTMFATLAAAHGQMLAAVEAVTKKAKA